MTADETLPAPLQGMIQHMDNMMDMLLELSQTVHGQDNSVADQTVTPLASVSAPQPWRRRARPQNSPTCDVDISEIMRQTIEQRLRQFSLVDGATSHEDSSSDEEQVTTRKRKDLKSDMDWTGAIMVLKHITWPHEVLYVASGNLAAYDELTVAAFMHRYLIVVNLEDRQVNAQLAQQ